MRRRCDGACRVGSDVVKNNIAKNTAHGKLVAKVNDIDTSGFVLKTNMQQINQN